ncbi:Nif3-like dinuclear metal center hexameric protein [uncultured Methanospirillum sp.]|uniref:Nif3-like dinuclear metal center hexameric protein n=1 Tax=uncultured Methanospirillum sp. TaxID=262503 RepID=UPI0029C7183E|nr:Nif3-like dinuclear metal center hexameric protein [uncultured Methanospirillum sp.]
MNGKELFYRIEEKIPLKLALPTDRVGYIGKKDPGDLEILRILLLMDYYPEEGLDYTGYDLIVLHHPPRVPPLIPAYVIHSNWDLLYGGACDALADCMKISCTDVLDPATGLGRIGEIESGPILLSRFVRYVMRALKIGSVRTVNYSEDRLIFTVGLVSGFGLNQDLIRMAQHRGIDLYLSGDLTHPGAILAKQSDLVLIDASHHATELPGLFRLGEVLSGLGVEVTVKDTGVPFGVYSDHYRPVSYLSTTLDREKSSVSWETGYIS